MLIRLKPLLLFVLSVVVSLTYAPRSADSEDGQPVRIDVGDLRLNSILLDPAEDAELPPIVFIHGASTSLYDPMFSFREKLQGRAKLLFVDRPGHGASDMGDNKYIFPDAQADAIATLMARRGIAKAVVVGHSFGGAIAAALAVRHPQMVSGLVLLSPAVYPWQGGVAWYYDAANAPIAGGLFSTLVVPPIGLIAIDSATRGVFAPNKRPDSYVKETRALQALRPAKFRRNAQEIVALSQWAETASRNYRQIKVPTVIITGDADEIVSPALHARRLARDIEGARLIVVHNLGHKSDYVANDLAIAAIERVSGRRVSLRSISREIETRIAADGKN